MPPNTVTTIYQLDSSYTNAIRMIPSGVPDFQEYITAYGDFEIRIAARTKSNVDEVISIASQRLGFALQDFYGPNPSDDVRTAIRDIQSH